MSPTLGEGDLPTPTGHPSGSSGVAFGSYASKLYVGDARVYAAIGDAIAAEAPDAPTVTGEGGQLDPSGGSILLFAEFSSDGGAPVAALVVTIDDVLMPNQGYDLSVTYQEASDRWDVEITEDGGSLSGAVVAISGTNVVGTGSAGSVTLDTV